MYSKLSIRKSECFDNGWQASQTEVGGQDEGRGMPFEIGLSGDQNGQGQRQTTWTRRHIFTQPPSEGLKMHVATMMTGHDDGNHADGPFEMATWDVSRAHFYGEARRWVTHIFLKNMNRRARWPDSAGVCMVHEMQRQFGETHG